MLTSSLLIRLAGIVLPVCIGISIYLYSYPYFQGCAFPVPAPRDVARNGTSAKESPKPLPTVAPFRLLVLADPQLEGDSSIAHFDSLLWEPRLLIGGLRTLPLRQVPVYLFDNVVEAILGDLPKIPGNIRKSIDLFGNDFYLAHIYRTLRQFTEPSHVTVLGDLLGSQWISDEEFEWRAWRYWNRVFKSGKIGSGHLLDETPEDTHETRQIQAEILGDDPDWKDKIINIVGNHDIGYAGDIDKARIDRFEKHFGLVNWKITFTLPISDYTEPPKAGSEEIDPKKDHPPEIHIIVLNTMNIDGPVWEADEQKKTYDFINKVITTSRPVRDDRTVTLLLTHIPLYKPEGICVDGPFMDYFVESNNEGVREQNHLSEFSSKNVLEGIFGLSANYRVPGEGFGRKGLILNGHDHEGCEAYHWIPPWGRGDPSWQVLRYNETVGKLLEGSNSSRTQVDGAPFLNMPGLREVTFRSMMGEFGGYAALLSVWWDDDAEEWLLDFQRCKAGIQHWWWAVHIIDVIGLVLIMCIPLLQFIERQMATRRDMPPAKKTKIPKKKKSSRKIRH